MFSTIDRATEEILIELPQHRNRHKGGAINFGPDGMLWVTIGDSQDPWIAQDTTDLRGSVIRIDVTSTPDPGLAYRIPTDNPFYHGGPDGTDTQREIYAYGLRNPWKASFDVLSGRFFIADVGEDGYEEINLLVPGANYGWPMYEGPDCFLGPCVEDDLVFPVGGYPHVSGNNAVIGGFVYYGTEIPHLFGVYIFANLNGRMFGLRPVGDGEFEQFMISSGIGVPIVAFGQDLAGEIYILPAWHGDLSIRKLIPTGTPQPSSFPTRLSDHPALFAAGSGEGTTVPGVIAYEPSAKLWSDWTTKERVFALPGLEQMTYREKGGWDFPDDSIIVKNFLLPLDRQNPDTSLKRIETRLLLRKEGAWHGYSYEWNDNETDALLLTAEKNRQFTIHDSEGVQRSQTWYFPSRTDCMACHTQTSNVVLGLNTAQMNYEIPHPPNQTIENQLRAYEYVSLFDQPLPADPEHLPKMPDYLDQSQSIHHRARAYLAANCAMCHAPGGTAPTSINLEWEAALSQTFLLDFPPDRGDMGIEGARIIDPGSPETSILLQRIKTKNKTHRMPPLGTSEPDPAGIALIEEWILTLEFLSVSHETWAQYQ